MAPRRRQRRQPKPKMGRVHKHRDALSLVCRADPQWRKAIIQQAPKDFVDCISECCLNLLKGVVPLTPHQKGVLKRKKQHLRDLANRQVSVTEKKKILQTGKGLPFLPMILGPILGKAIGPAIGGVLDKIF